MRGLGVLKDYISEISQIASRVWKYESRLNIFNQKKRGESLKCKKIHVRITQVPHWNRQSRPQWNSLDWAWVNFLGSNSRAPHKRSNIRAIPRRRSPEENANWISVTACPTPRQKTTGIPRSLFGGEVCMEARIDGKVVEVLDFGKLVCSVMTAATSFYINDMHQTNKKTSGVAPSQK